MAKGTQGDANGPILMPNLSSYHPPSCESEEGAVMNSILFSGQASL